MEVCEIKQDFDECPTEQFSMKNVSAIESNGNSIELRKKAPIGCRLCKKKIYKALTYDSHWKMFHRNINPAEMYYNAYQCSKCNRYFQHEQSLKSHVRSSHSKRKSDNVETTASDDQGTCPLCRAIVKGFSDLRQHLENVHSDLCLQSNKNQEKNDSSVTACVDNSPSPIPKEYLCSKCGLLFDDEHSLTFHVLRNCSRIVKGNSALTKHLEKLHNIASSSRTSCQSVAQFSGIERELHCSTCGLVCDNEEELSFHVLHNCSKDQNAPSINIGVTLESLQNHLELSQSKDLAPLGEMVVALQPFELYPLVPCSVNETRESANSILPFKVNKDLVYNSGNGQFECPVDYSSDQFIGAAEGQTISSSNGTEYHLINLHPPSSSQRKFVMENNSNVNPAKANIEETIRTNFSIRQFKEKRNRISDVVTNRVNCRICGQSFVKCRNYRTHFLLRHSEYSKDDMFDEYIKCNVCLDVFQTLSGFKTHYMYQHKEIYNKEGMSINFTRQSNKDKNLVPCQGGSKGTASKFACTLCNLPSKTKNGYCDKHKKLTQENDEDDCSSVKDMDNDYLNAGKCNTLSP